jgi:membrane protein YdbS with pleckstrin-like domain
MRKNPKIKIDEEFKPAPQFKKLYYIYLLLGILIGVLPWCLPLVLFIPRVSDNAPFVLSLILIPLLSILIFIAYWIPKFYDTMLYKLTENEVVWRRGVWFKQTGIVPYNRITNIDTIQGPISRKLGIAALQIQTAGYSGQQTKAEIGIKGIEQFEALKDLLMDLIRGKKPEALETYDEGNVNVKIHDELLKIRELLEKSSRK